MKPFQLSRYMIAAVSLGVITACSDSANNEVDTSNASSVPTEQTSIAGNASIAAELTTETGRFVDSAVEGLTYRTSTQFGITDTDGAFSYVPGEDVTFSIGSIEFPAVSGAALVTPLNVFSTDDIAHPGVVNLARLLQTLDEDSNPDNGILLSATAAASATGLDIDFTSEAFDANVANLVANSGSSTTQLIDNEEALGHLQETLYDEGVMERPQMQSTTASSGSTENSATHPLVGTVRELTSRSHEIAGVVTIVDDRTIEVSNFVYDGEGPSVFFYSGVNGDYDADGNGRIISDMLNGRRYDGDTIVLTLPADQTLDDFNGISVWCDVFNVSFGDVEF